MGEGITLEGILNSPEARFVLESAPFGTVLVDTGLNIRYFNGLQARYFGFSGDRTKPAELIGKALFRGVPFSGKDEEAWALLQKMLQGNLDSASMDSVEAGHNGKTKYFDMHFSRLEGGIRVDAYDVTGKVLEAYIDGLTRVFNRKYFDEKLMPSLNGTSQIKGKQGMSYSVGFLYIDLGKFKELNDSEGHTAGDQMLREVAILLENNVVRETDYVVRLGGDEFLVVLPGITEDNIGIVEKRLKQAQALFNMKRADSGRPQMHMDIGAAIGTSAYKTAIKSAEERMYWMKKNPR
ncbi:diguanylate cyclase [Candidatus Woesearchaeota archaeon]|nr:diguanylate cyclase [Candidatus Woesearchaeota archaeon]